MKTIDITALEWFDKSAGNSYFAATVVMDYTLPTEQTITLPFQYGYGNHYVHMACNEMEKRGFLPGLKHHKNGSSEPLWQYCDRHGITLRCHKHEGCKKRELTALT